MTDVLSVQAARSKCVRLLYAAQQRAGYAEDRWGIGSTVARTRRLYVAELDGLLDRLGSDDPIKVARACETVTSMGEPVYG